MKLDVKVILVCESDVTGSSSIYYCPFTSLCGKLKKSFGNGRR